MTPRGRAQLKAVLESIESGHRNHAFPCFRAHAIVLRVALVIVLVLAWLGRDLVADLRDAWSQR